VLAQHLVGLAVPPRRGAERLRPGIGVALALDADQHRGRGVLVRLGIAAGLVLADPQIEAVAGHERLDPAGARPAAVCWARGGAVLTMSGMRLVRRIASPRIGSGSMSSRGLKKSSAPAKRSLNV